MSLYPPDPWRALQLPRDASLEEVKAAYRRLAKRYHPDSAGESALPRFLAIQAAYESLTEGPYRLRLGTGRSPNGSGPRSRRPATNAGSTDARSEAHGAKTSGGTAAGARRGATGSGRASTPGSGPESRPGGSDRAYSTRRPNGNAERGAGHGSKGGRPRRRAKPGSTSYDEAAAEPFQPDWSGGSWYGESSGTYWTINPKEYADPRKHGPEYQARARRAAADRYSMPGERPEPNQPGDPEPRQDPVDAAPAGPSRPQGQGFSGAAVDWSAAYPSEGTADAWIGPDRGEPPGRQSTDEADALWSSPAGLIGLALVALVAVTIAMLAFDGAATGSARPSIVWVGSAALLVIMLVRVVVAARRGSH
ncbi:MAG TPA: DnaJ domain-containing protein [Candidatus Acidoferrum sp.]|nr:DnaJ domain-containing protein [Candidatus Acidoferrum sp.]